MKFSTADVTLLRIRCQRCRQHSEKLVALLVGKDAMPCSSCGGKINLATTTNKLLISETAANCARLGAVLIEAVNSA
jgi:rRNA maturation endonuclease Nob1